MQYDRFDLARVRVPYTVVVETAGGPRTTTEHQDPRAAAEAMAKAVRTGPDGVRTDGILLQRQAFIGRKQIAGMSKDEAGTILGGGRHLRLSDFRGSRGDLVP